MCDNLTHWLTSFPDTGNTNDDEQEQEGSQRQERIRKAFEDSKESYKNELVVLSPCFFRVDEPSNVVNIANNDRFGLQNIDASVQEAYINHEYQRVLDLCLAYLNGVEEGKIVLEGAGSARDREYFDIALRTCLGLPDLETGVKLAERSRHLWKTYYVIGMSAARIHIALGRPRDAISTLLASVPPTDRHPFYKLLAECFSLWYNKLTSSASTESTQASAVLALYSLLHGYDQRTSGPYYHGALSATPSLQRTLPEDAEVLSWCVSTRLEELEALYALCTTKQSAACEDSTAVERSVRTL